MRMIIDVNVIAEQKYIIDKYVNSLRPSDAYTSVR